MNTNIKKGKLMHDVLHVVDGEINDRTYLPQGARKMAARNESTLLRAIADAGLTPIANAIGKDQSYVSRFRSGEQGLKMVDVLALLEAVGFKLITAGDDMRIINEEDYKTLLNLANKGLRALNNEVRRD